MVLWLAVVGGVAAAAAQAPAAPPDDDTIPGTELQQANDLLERDFHANADGASAQLVFVAPDGRKVTASAYEKAIGEAADSSQVAGASDPFADHTVSEDGSTALATVNYTAVSDDLTTGTRTRCRTLSTGGTRRGSRSRSVATRCTPLRRRGPG
ncbi:MMPL family transporter [Actinacidiphila alni]|uniref:MMPL family transporter n=1 Tax=Actinacidiphila alni TaxID=380248 RepID=UPI003898DA55